MKSYWLRNATWENAAKDRIKAVKETVDGNKTNRQEMIVTKFIKDGKVNPDYNDIINHIGIPRLDQNTARAAQAERERRRREDQARKDKENTLRLEQLFQLKIDAFEIPEIKESQNRELRSKLRKAKTPMEVNIYATMIAVDSMNNPAPVVEETAVEEKPKTTRKTSAKKAAEPTTEETNDATE